MERTDNNAVCLAGEFAALSQLSLRNYNASMTLGHTKGVDILVSAPRSRKMYRLEVKTKLRTTDNRDTTSTIFGRVLGEWMMNKKHETHNPLLFYCFVIIWKRTKRFRFFIIPSKVVARYVVEEHQLWLRKRKKKRTKDNDMRNFRIGFDKEKYPINTPTVKEYEDNWKFRRRLVGPAGHSPWLGVPS